MNFNFVNCLLDCNKMGYVPIYCKKEEVFYLKIVYLS